MIDLSKTYLSFALYPTEPTLNKWNCDTLKIYELAAVKIKEGKMVELLSTFLDIGLNTEKEREEFILTQCE